MKINEIYFALYSLNRTLAMPKILPLNANPETNRDHYHY